MFPGSKRKCNNDLLTMLQCSHFLWWLYDLYVTHSRRRIMENVHVIFVQQLFVGGTSIWGIVLNFLSRCYRFQYLWFSMVAPAFMKLPIVKPCNPNPQPHFRRIRFLYVLSTCSCARCWRWGGVGGLAVGLALQNLVQNLISGMLGNQLHLGKLNIVVEHRP